MPTPSGPGPLPGSVAAQPGGCPDRTATLRYPYAVQEATEPASGACLELQVAWVEDDIIPRTSYDDACWPLIRKPLPDGSRLVDAIARQRMTHHRIAPYRPALPFASQCPSETGVRLADLIDKSVHGRRRRFQREPESESAGVTV